jgi:hypothetical protein
LSKNSETFTKAIAMQEEFGSILLHDSSTIYRVLIILFFAIEMSCYNYIAQKVNAKNLLKEARW